MKKTLILAVLVGFSLFTQAQDVWDSGAYEWNEDKTGSHALGFYIGFERSNVYSNINKLPSTKREKCLSINGPQVGLLYEKMFIKGLGLFSGLNYTFGTQKTDWQVVSVQGDKTRSRLLYQKLDLHFDLQYKFKIAQNTYLGLMTGPAMQTQLQMQLNDYMKHTNGNISTTDKIDYFSQNDIPDGISRKVNVTWIIGGPFQKINATWNVGAFFQWKQFFFRFSYGFGLMNAYQSKYYHRTEDNVYDVKSHFNHWNMRLGMFLWQK